MSQIETKEETTEQTQEMAKDQDAAVIEHVQRHAREYGLVKGLEPVPVFLEKRSRRQSALYRFAAHSGTRPVILVKVPLLLNASPAREGGGGLREDGQDCSPEMSREALQERPRIVPLLDFATKYRCEFDALDAIERHFSALDDPRFGAVRVLGRIDGLRALVMEEVQEPVLRRLFGAASRLSPARPRDLEPVFRNAGAWLHAFHGMPAAQERPVLQARREQFVAKVREFTGYLGGEVGRQGALRRMADTMSAAAASVLPEEMPVGMRHGDWAMRNILVAPNNRITVLDTLAYCRTPIYDDIAYFLTELKWSWPQIYSLGMVYSPRRLAGYEQAFLEGYFGADAIPWPAIRLFEMQARLDKWAARVERDRNRPVRPHHFAERVQQYPVGATFHAILEQLRRQIERDAALGGPATAG